eukprot:935286-Prorocentrum_minimum.AAC.1
MSYLLTDRVPAWVVGSSAECNRALVPLVMAAIINSKDLRRCANEKPTDKESFRVASRTTPPAAVKGG